MEIRIRANGAVMFEQEFRSWLLSNGGPNFDVLTPEIMELLEVDPVLEGPQVSGGDKYQFSQRDGVEEINGQWFTKYVLGPVFQDTAEATAAEQEATYKKHKDEEQAAQVRIARNNKLAETDWRFRSDMSPSQGWVDYCRALRDITKQEGFPWTIDWPVQPE